MEFVIAVLICMVIVLQALQLRATHDIITRLRVISSNMVTLGPRQSRRAIRNADGSGTRPVMERPKTSTRDTNDIPARGARIGTAVHRKLSHGSDSPEAELQ
jgi:hypothetical protein